MGAQNFYFAHKVSQKLEFSISDFAFFDESYSTAQIAPILFCCDAIGHRLNTFYIAFP